MTLPDQMREATIASKKTAMYAVGVGVGVGVGVDHAVLSRFLFQQLDVKLATADKIATFFKLELCKTRTKINK